MPRTPSIFKTIKEEVLGSDYELSVVFVTPSEIKKLNKIYRGIDKATDILSFPLGKNEGEVYICKNEARKEAPKFGLTYDSFIKFLLIHGCVHLKGHDNGATMERIEAKLRRKLKI